MCCVLPLECLKGGGFMKKLILLLICIFVLQCDTYIRKYDDKTIEITHEYTGETQTIDAYTIDEYQEGIVVYWQDETGHHEERYANEIYDYKICYEE